MNYKVTGFNNFCRVFSLPDAYPKGYCFGGGLPTNFTMVDWFNPVVNLPQWAISEERYKELVLSGEIDTKGHEVEINSDELQKELIDFLLKKKYMQKGKKYLVICDFGMSFTFTKE
jgi:hypothetical protein